MNGSDPDVSVFRINQTGYAAGLPVHAAVLTQEELFLTDEKGTMIRRFSPCSLSPDEASGDRVVLLDLGLLPEGVYTLSSPSQKRKLTVAQVPWRSVTHALIRGLYYQRCGCALPEEFAGKYARPACHTAPAQEWGEPGIRRRVTGGWHDAGDYGRYTGPGAVAAAHLLYAWLLFPEGCSDELNIPETGNGIPDILSEAAWELRWLLQMQRQDGAFHHKLTKKSFAPFIMPQDDRETEYLMPISSCATAAACACLALGARIFRPLDEAFSGRMLLSALRAWRWLTENPDPLPFRNPEGVRTGQYGDPRDADERFWAACELYASTGDEMYRKEAGRQYAAGQHLTSFGWADTGGLGAMCCLFCSGEKAGDELHATLKEDFLRQSERSLYLSRASGYGTALSPDGYVWGSILPILNNAMAMILHERLTGREDMRNAALLQWHYALGLNALDLCFVTGFGEKSVRHPHHRPSGADGIEAPVPGLIAGGPNKRFPYPSTRERLGDQLPAARYYLDETPSADTNEVAVYWNSPAVFAAAYFNMLSIRAAQGRTEK